MSTEKPTPFSAQTAAAPTPNVDCTPPLKPRRINPWRLFVGSVIPNWLQRRTEISQGAKLAYARLAQYAGKDGECFPKQDTLAVELGVSNRTANEYIRILVHSGLVEKERLGLGLSNRYYFLDHPWIHEGQPEASIDSGQNQQNSSTPDRRSASGQEQRETSLHVDEEIQMKESQKKRRYPHSPPEGDTEKNTGSTCSREVEIYAVYPRQVGKPAALRAIRRALAKYPADFLLERTQLYARTCNAPAQFIPHASTWFRQERFNDDPTTWRRTAGPSGKPQPPRQFTAADYHQLAKDF